MGALTVQARHRGARISILRRCSKLLRYLRLLRKRRRALALICVISGAALLIVAVAFPLIAFVSAFDAQVLLSSLRFPANQHTAHQQGGSIHLAIVLDDSHRPNFTASTIRSLLHYASRRIELHVVAPPAAHEQLEMLFGKAAGLHLYDVALCEAPVSQVSFISQNTALAELCALFLPDLLPPFLHRVLYVDVRATTVVADIAPCTHAFNGTPGTTLLAATVDLSDTCAVHPHFCYPLAFDWSLPPGLVCGTTPTRASRLKLSSGSPGCHPAGSREPLAMHSGVLLMHLPRMRQHRFTERIVQASIHTWRALHYRSASRGASDLLNNFLRLFPDSLADMQCGCNYQFAASRRVARCPARVVRVARGDLSSIGLRSSHDPYVRHFNFWRCPQSTFSSSQPPSPPPLPALSLHDHAWAAPHDAAPSGGGRSREFVAARRAHVPLCEHQPFACAKSDRAAALSLSLSIMRDRVYVLTRTSARPFFFSHMAQSVAEQTHPYVTHVVGTDDQVSLQGYLRGFADVVRFAPPTRAFDQGEVCRKCRTAGGPCAKAPGLASPKTRQAYFDCYCSTGYPMNLYINELQARVHNGWVLYVDDDNLLASRFAVSELLAAARNRDAMLAFRSHLGRGTPTGKNFANRRIVMGDFDASNFAFHSRKLHMATWPNTRCGDFRTAARMGAQLPTQWVDRTVIHANPLRAALGGLGARNDIALPAVTVVVTTHRATGWRPGWVREIIRAYTADSMAHLVARVIVVWNNPQVPLPAALADDKVVAALKQAGRMVVVRPDANSLNSRWTVTLGHIESDIVLNLDDDVYVRREALVCMLSWLRREPSRMVGPFVRRISKTGAYVLDELLDSSSYSVVLPRVLLLPTTYVRAYARSDRAHLRAYVDEQAAHCDDILLNMVALNISQKPPLRVLLPENSVIDFYDRCWPKSKQLTGGLGLQPGRSRHRTECVRTLMRMVSLTAFKSIAHIATCLPRGNALLKLNYIPRARYIATKTNSFSCGLGEDDG